MPTLSETTPALGWKAKGFDLEGTDGKRHSLAALRGAKGTLVMFICNHCPYVQAVLDDIIADARELAAAGVTSVAIMPNDTRAYPADSFDNMKRLAGEKRLPFPYFIHQTHARAPAYCPAPTPAFLLPPPPPLP